VKELLAALKIKQSVNRNIFALDKSLKCFEKVHTMYFYRAVLALNHHIWPFVDFYYCLSGFIAV
jgi:hypothetical protein